MYRSKIYNKLALPGSADKSMISKSLNRAIILLSFFLFTCYAACAQGELRMLPPDKIAAEIKPLKPKTVVFVFDVTQSTRHNDMFTRERAATSTILRDGCNPSDHVVMLSFGTGYTKIFDKKLENLADANSLVEDIPGSTAPGRGTNIRSPHHEALKIIKADMPQQGVIILLTDSFNDQPAPDDPNLKEYQAYYSPKGLTVYPNTPENKEYEKNLSTLLKSGKFRQYGVGVAINSDGRPIERLPTGANESDSAAAGGIGYQPEQGPREKERVAQGFNFWPWLIGLLLLLLILWILSLLRRPAYIRLRLGEKGSPRDYRLKSGARVGIGGNLGSIRPGDDIFPISSLKEPVAYILGSRGSAILESAGSGTASVLHNGQKLESSSPLRFGDEIRVVVPDAGGAGTTTEYKVFYIDPKSA